jgi:hypothetical protein
VLAGKFSGRKSNSQIEAKLCKSVCDRFEAIGKAFRIMLKMTVGAPVFGHPAVIKDNCVEAF